MNKIDSPETESQLLSILKKNNEPVSIDFVRYHLKIQWNTARALLFSMVLGGKIKGQKTSKSWIFWVGKEEDAP